MSDNALKTRIMGDIVQVNDPEVLKIVAEMARNRRDDLLTAKTANVFTGDKVQMLPEHQDRKLGDAVGTVTKVNPKRFKVDFGALGRYTVPKSMVQKVE